MWPRRSRCRGTGATWFSRAVPFLRVAVDCRSPLRARQRLFPTVAHARRACAHSSRAPCSASRTSLRAKSFSMRGNSGAVLRATRLTSRTSEARAPIPANSDSSHGGQLLPVSGCGLQIVETSGSIPLRDCTSTGTRDARVRASPARLRARRRRLCAFVCCRSRLAGDFSARVGSAARTAQRRAGGLRGCTRRRAVWCHRATGRPLRARLAALSISARRDSEMHSRRFSPRAAMPFS